MEKKKDTYEKNACEFKNEQYCEEEIEDEGEEVSDVEKKHFEEDDDMWE